MFFWLVLHWPFLGQRSRLLPYPGAVVLRPQGSKHPSCSAALGLLLKYYNMYADSVRIQETVLQVRTVLCGSGLLPGPREPPAFVCPLLASTCARAATAHPPE